MLTTDLLSHHFAKQRNILVDLNISVKNMQRLKEDKFEYEEQIKRHGFFQHHWYQLKFISIVQLSKLYSNRATDLLSFHKLFRKFETSPFSDEFKQLLTANSNRYNSPITSREDLKLLVSKNTSSISDHSVIIDKVTDARDKVYAHEDPNATVNQVTSDEIKKVVVLANSIYNSFQLGIFNSTELFEFQKGWDIDFVLRYVSRQREADFEKMKE